MRACELRRAHYSSAKSQRQLAHTGRVESARGDLAVGLSLQLVDGGTAMRVITSIHDAIDALVLMLQRPHRAVNQIYNIGNRDNEVTIAELAELMRGIYAEISGDPSYRHHPIESVSSRAFYGEGYEDCDRRMPNVDNTLALGWAPKIGLTDILTETLRYYYDQYGAGKGGGATGCSVGTAKR